jgi:class 3 adenylate cyclase
VRCALSIVETVREPGFDARSGVHTGEVEVRGDGLSGVGVHIGARGAALAGSGEVLVTRTVRDLSAGSGLTFEDRGTHRFKSVPDEWQRFGVTG